MSKTLTTIALLAAASFAHAGAWEADNLPDGSLPPPYAVKADAHAAAMNCAFSTDCDTSFTSDYATTIADARDAAMAPAYGVQCDSSDKDCLDAFPPSHNPANAPLPTADELGGSAADHLEAGPSWLKQVLNRLF